MPGDALGILQSDVLVRKALEAALADIRANPWLLDYVFAYLPKDGLTVSEYGHKEVVNAKRWFLANNVRVVMVTAMNAGDRLPAISVELVESTEANENTLGDVHYNPLEGVPAPVPTLTDPFTPTSWNSQTATLVLPPSAVAQVDVVPGMSIVLPNGSSYAITEVLDEATVVVVGAGENMNWARAVVQPPAPALVRHMESASFKETYSLGVHIHGEPAYLTYLHSVLVFCLLRYREVLLEARGFERSSFSSSDAARNAFFGEENVFSRYVTLQGYVRHYWPKLVVPTLTSVLVFPVVTSVTQDGTDTSSVVTPVDPTQVNTDLADAVGWGAPGDDVDAELAAKTAGYGLRQPGELQGPSTDDDNGAPDGPQGPAVQPQPNGQLASILEDEQGPSAQDVGTPQGNLPVDVSNLEDE